MKAKSQKTVTWDRTIICLPSCYPECSKSGKDIAIPRKKRAILAANGLIGKIHLESDWTEDDAFAEIRSVFSEAMENDTLFPFKMLLPTGSGTKSLTVPSLSHSFKWTPKEVAGKAGSTIYILAEKSLKVQVYKHTYIHAYARTCMHKYTYTHTYVHTYILVEVTLPFLHVCCFCKQLPIIKELLVQNAPFMCFLVD